MLDKSLAFLISKEYPQRRRVIPVARTDQTDTVAVRDPGRHHRARRPRRASKLPGAHRHVHRRPLLPDPHPDLRREPGGWAGPSARRAGQGVRRRPPRSPPCPRRPRGARGAHEKLLQEHQAMTQLLAEQRARNDWNTQVRTDLHAAQDTCGESTRRPSPGSAERPERISKRWRACGRRPPRFGQPRRSWRPRMPPSGPSWTRMSSGPTPSGHAMRSVRE